jgi:hypothetical protein
MQPAEPYVPWAAKQQAVYDDSDHLLTALARRNHPTCVHWWGRRIDGSMAVAQCYIDGVTLTTWQSRYPPNPNQRERIMRHRRQHLATLPVQSRPQEIRG